MHSVVYNLQRLLIIQLYCYVTGPPHSINQNLLFPNHTIGKDPDAGRDWGQEEKGTTEDEMTGWHHRLDGHEFE